jgi:hypothetical protein
MSPGGPKDLLARWPALSRVRVLAEEHARFRARQPLEACMFSSARCKRFACSKIAFSPALFAQPQAQRRPGDQQTLDVASPGIGQHSARLRNVLRSGRVIRWLASPLKRLPRASGWMASLALLTLLFGFWSCLCDASPMGFKPLQRRSRANDAPMGCSRWNAFADLARNNETWASTRLSSSPWSPPLHRVRLTPSWLDGGDIFARRQCETNHRLKSLLSNGKGNPLLCAACGGC